MKKSHQRTVISWEFVYSTVSNNSGKYWHPLKNFFYIAKSRKIPTSRTFVWKRASHPLYFIRLVFLVLFHSTLFFYRKTYVLCIPPIGKDVSVHNILRESKKIECHYEEDTGGSADRRVVGRSSKLWFGATSGHNDSADFLTLKTITLSIMGISVFSHMCTKKKEANFVGNLIIATILFAQLRPIRKTKTLKNRCFFSDWVIEVFYFKCFDLKIVWAHGMLQSRNVQAQNIFHSLRSCNM